MPEQETDFLDSTDLPVSEHTEPALDQNPEVREMIRQFEDPIPTLRRLYHSRICRELLMLLVASGLVWSGIWLSQDYMKKELARQEERDMREAVDQLIEKLQ